MELKLPKLQGATLNQDRTHRYKLWRVWDKTQPLCLWVMLNPSTGDENMDDPTIRRVRGFSKSWGFGGFFICNLFTYITADPQALAFQLDFVKWSTRINWDFINDKAIEEVVSMIGSNNVIFAWGNSVAGNEHLEQRAQKMIERFPRAKCLGISLKGQPKHPLMLPSKTLLSDFPGALYKRG